VFVFVFFGLVATVGTTYVAVERVTDLSVVMGCAAGCLSCALLAVNNLRDLSSDAAAGKRTLAVRLGDGRTRWLYVVLLVGAFALAAVAAVWRPAVLLAMFAVVVAVPPVRAVRGGARGGALIAVLGQTGRLQLAYGALAALGLALGG
jgi:1,4-dihydroxy-2-naphthoate octaprenyltransferase